MEYQNLRFLQDALLQTHNVCSWTMTQENQLLFSNCQEQDFFFHLFMLGGCSNAIQQHFNRSNTPILTADSIGFVWIAVRQKPGERDQIPLIHLLGPLYFSDVTEAHLRQRLNKLHIAKEFENRLLQMVHDLPTVQNDIALSFANMLHFCLNDETVKKESIPLWNERFAKEEATWGKATWEGTRWHGTWIGEQRFFQSVIEGRLDGIRELSTGEIGNIGGGDLLRQAKNEIIVFSVLCSRGAILGGVSSEGALNLADYFIQLVEAAKTVPEVYQLGGAMHGAFIERVQLARANQEHSPLIRACVDYIETHIYEHIRVGDIASEAGYTENHISRSFKAEMGVSLLEYINRRKIKVAKAILLDNTIPMAELSDRLSFSNPSYFSAVFKKHTGVTPGEYARKYGVLSGTSSHDSEEK